MEASQSVGGNPAMKNVAFLLLSENKMDKDLLGKYMLLYGYETIAASDLEYDKFEQRKDEVAFLITNIVKEHLNESSLITKIDEHHSELPILAVIDNSTTGDQLSSAGRANLFTIKKPLKCKEVYASINKLIDLAH